MTNTNNDRVIADGVLRKSYLDKLEDIIVDHLNVEAHSDAARDKLIASLGFHDDQLIQELVDAGMTAESIICLHLLPLVLVAWANGNVDPHEREAVLKSAGKLAIRDTSVAYAVLDHWLHERPPAGIIYVWRDYMHDATSKMNPIACKNLEQQMEVQMTAIAHASGGRLGFGTVSKDEQRMIDGMLVALRNQLPKIESTSNSEK